MISDWFYKITADVFPPCHCVNPLLNAADQQNAKTSALTVVATLADNYLMMWI